MGIIPCQTEFDTAQPPFPEKPNGPAVARLYSDTVYIGVDVSNELVVESGGFGWDLV
jgi:hypothetical protein